MAGGHGAQRQHYQGSAPRAPGSQPRWAILERHPHARDSGARPLPGRTGAGRTHRTPGRRLVRGGASLWTAVAAARVGGSGAASAPRAWCPAPWPAGAAWSATRGRRPRPVGPCRRRAPPVAWKRKVSSGSFPRATRRCRRCRRCWWMTKVRSRSASASASALLAARRRSTHSTSCDVATRSTPPSSSTALSSGDTDVASRNRGSRRRARSSAISAWTGASAATPRWARSGAAHQCREVRSRAACRRA